ncbi:11107_t:CDS:2, partial [Racocetra fulgida]
EELDLGDFTYLRRLSGIVRFIYYGVKDETKLTFKNKPEKAEIIKLVQAQKYINQQYPSKEEREKETRLYIREKNLQGYLDLSEFINLKVLGCSGNQLTSLNLTNCSQLEEINCSNNQLTNIILPPNPTNLKELRLYNNNFISNLSFLTPAINLEYLNLADNKFIGSLDYLSEMRQLKSLNISDTDINEVNIEQLPRINLKLIVKEKEFVQQQPQMELLIPHEQFTNIQYLAEVVLKVLNNSQNITTDFLQEIAYPTTKKYLMVMDYVPNGDLRQYWKNNCLPLKSKLSQLLTIAEGLKSIHEKELVHRDLHPGNILNRELSGIGSGNVLCYITDLGLSRLVNEIEQEGKIYGQMTYISPEVLLEQPYTKASDIYSFGIIAYELLANSYPYPETNDLELSLKVCQGYRPDIDKVLIPQLLKDLIKKKEIKDRKNAKFHQQYQTIEKEYNTFSQKPYQIHPNATLTSKMIDTKEITTRLQSLKIGSKQIDFDIPEEDEQQPQIEIPPKNN